MDSNTQRDERPTTGVLAGAPHPVGDRVLSLDGVRGLAILIVLIHNSAFIAGTSHLVFTQLVTTATAAGWVGVQLFFTLSGLLITGILLDARGHDGYFRSFYLRRSLRIFPLYFAFVASAVFLAPRFAWDPDWVADVQAQQWAYWLYLSNWTQPFHRGITGLSHLWSLAVEEQFYLVWPFVVYWLNRRRLVQVAVVLIVTAPFIRLALRLMGAPAEAPYMFMVARWDALAAGALLAAMLRDEGGRRIVRVWTARAALASLSALALITLITRGFITESPLVEVLGESLIVLLSTALLAASLQPREVFTPLRTFLEAPWLRTFGKYSYAMYVLHFPIQGVLRHYFQALVQGPDTPWRVLRLVAYLSAVLVLTFVAALVSWVILERPFLNLKDRFAPRVG